MSSNDIALRVSGLGKSYTIRHQDDKHITLAEQALSRLRHPLRRSPSETFWALRNVDLEVKRGEVLGIIGGNGAGKSTLLKILSRITAPTEGRIELYGRIGSLLEVGTGFHPELTGRENIYLNGTILGMKKVEINRRFDEIVQFAGVEKFLDTPVKRYSSGMYVRLAFAVAAHLETEIVLLDEVLAVADVAFQERSLGKMRDVAASGRTVLLVSHQFAIIQALASKVLVLDQGSVLGLTEPDEAIAAYSASRTSRAKVGVTTEGKRWDPTLSRLIEVVGVQAQQEQTTFGSEDAIQFLVALKFHEPLSSFRMSLTVAAMSGSPIGSGFAHAQRTPDTEAGTETEEYLVAVHAHRLAPGHYTLNMAVGLGDNESGMEEFDIIVEAFAFEVSPIETSDGLIASWSQAWGSVILRDITLKPLIHAEGFTECK